MMTVTTGRIYTNGLDYGIRRIDNGGIDIITPDEQFLATGVSSLREAIQIAQTDSKDSKYDYLRDYDRSNQIMWPRHDEGEMKMYVTIHNYDEAMEIFSEINKRMYPNNDGFDLKEFENLDYPTTIHDDELEDYGLTIEDFNMIRELTNITEECKL